MSALDRTRTVGHRIDDFLEDFLRPGADRRLARLRMVQIAELAQQQALNHMAGLREPRIATRESLNQLIERIAHGVLDVVNVPITASRKARVLAVVREHLTAREDALVIVPHLGHTDP